MLARIWGVWGVGERQRGRGEGRIYSCVAGGNGDHWAIAMNIKHKIPFNSIILLPRISSIEINVLILKELWATTFIGDCLWKGKMKNS